MGQASRTSAFLHFPTSNSWSSAFLFLANLMSVDTSAWECALPPPTIAAVDAETAMPTVPISEIHYSNTVKSTINTNVERVSGCTKNSDEQSTNAKLKRTCVKRQMYVCPSMPRYSKSLYCLTRKVKDYHLLAIVYTVLCCCKCALQPVVCEQRGE